MDRKLLRIVIPVFVVLLFVTAVLLLVLRNETSVSEYSGGNQDVSTTPQPMPNGISIGLYDFGEGKSAKMVKLVGTVEKKPYLDGDFYYTSIKVNTQEGDKVFVLKLGKPNELLGVNLVDGRVSPNEYRALPVNNIIEYIKQSNSLWIEFPVTEMPETNVCDERCLRLKDEIKNYGVQTEVLLSGSEFDDIQEIKISINQIFLATQ